jgi:hypothetical protein
MVEVVRFVAVVDLKGWVGGLTRIPIGRATAKVKGRTSFSRG